MVSYVKTRRNANVPELPLLWNTGFVKESLLVKN